MSKIAPGDFVSLPCGARRMVESAAHLVDHVVKVIETFPETLLMLFDGRNQGKLVI